ncbi:MAG: hypothetical protein WC648_02180 [Candidatus Paceibacterota bacterium]|jgi:hypothetical protein
MDVLITIILTSISIFIGIVAVYYAKRSDENFRSPKIDLELSPGHESFYIRNVGTDIALGLKENTNYFRDIPDRLWNFTGPIDYMRTKNYSVSKFITFHDSKMPAPSSSVLVNFEYQNTDGIKFYSHIEVKRGTPTQQLYFTDSRLLKWGKLKK